MCVGAEVPPLVVVVMEEEKMGVGAPPRSKIKDKKLVWR